MVIHHKEGTVKYYARAQDCLPLELLSDQDPFPSPLDGLCWRVARRVGGVGLLWNRASDAWLDVRKLSAKDRNAAFYRAHNGRPSPSGGGGGAVGTPLLSPLRPGTLGKRL